MQRNWSFSHQAGVAHVGGRRVPLAVIALVVMCPRGRVVVEGLATTTNKGINREMYGTMAVAVGIAGRLVRIRRVQSGKSG